MYTGWGLGKASMMLARLRSFLVAPQHLSPGRVCGSHGMHQIYIELLLMAATHHPADVRQRRALLLREA